MHKPEFIIENEAHKIQWFWDRNGSLHPGQKTRSSFNKKKKRHLGDFAFLVDHRGEIKESKKIDKYLDLAREQKKAEVHEGDCDTNYNLWNGPWMLGKGIGRIGNQWEYRYYNIVVIGQNTKKSPGDLEGLKVTQNPVKRLRGV